MKRLEQEHYSKWEVLEEIARFAKNRWVGVHCIEKDVKGNRIMIRYIDKKPIAIDSPRDLLLLMQRLGTKGLRSVYATAATYSKLRSMDDVKSLNNITLYTPTWDIDNDFKDWRSTVRACMEIIETLKEEGVEKSVFVKWSGNGAHVHLHERSISEKILKGRTSLDIAYAIVEYVKMKVEPKAQEIAVIDGCNIKVENKIDRQRMFTCPLSLHRDHDRVCVCIRPSQLHHFDPSWVDPQSYVHDKDWTLYEEGEADELAEKAINVIGGFPLRRTRGRKYPRLDKAIAKWLNALDDGENRG
jgi:hypothetical protein